MNFTDIPQQPPPRLTMKEVVAISGLSAGSIRKMKSEGSFPDPIYRNGQGFVFNGEQVYAALGYTQKHIDKEEPAFNEF